MKILTHTIICCLTVQSSHNLTNLNTWHLFSTLNIGRSLTCKLRFFEKNLVLYLCLYGVSGDWLWIWRIYWIPYWSFILVFPGNAHLQLLWTWHEADTLVLVADHLVNLEGILPLLTRLVVINSGVWLWISWILNFQSLVMLISSCYGLGMTQITPSLGTPKFRECVFARIFTWSRKAEILCFTTLWIKINYFYVCEIEQKSRIKFFPQNSMFFNFWCEITCEIMQFTNNFVSFRIISYKRWRGIAILKCLRNYNRYI